MPRKLFPTTADIVVFIEQRLDERKQEQCIIRARINKAPDPRYISVNTNEIAHALGCTCITASKYIHQLIAELPDRYEYRSKRPPAVRRKTVKMSQ